jgi:hypothetical protein
VLPSCCGNHSRKAKLPKARKQSYLKWSKNNADIERIEPFVMADAFGRIGDPLFDYRDIVYSNNTM